MQQRSPTPTSSLSTPRIVASPWVILLVLTMGFFMILLDTTIVNVAIPSIITGLNATLDQILWVLNAYILVYAVLLITAGRAGDMFGPKKLFMSGLVIFTLASAACGLAQSPNELILFRVIQGVGGALLTPQTMSIITSIFPPEDRGKAFGLWAGVAGLAAAAGPTLGGALTTAFSWRAIFYVNLPIGVMAVILAWLIMPELTIHRRHHLDVPGVILATAGLFSGVFALIEGEKYHWGPIWNAGAFSLGSMRVSLISIPSLLALGVVLLAIFVAVEARQEEPLLPLSLFSDRNFSLANLVSAIVAFGMLGLFLPLTIFLQSILGMSALHAGIALVPVALTSMVVAPVAGNLADKISAKWILGTGLVLYALGMGLVIWVANLNATGLTFTLPLIIAGVGMGCTFAPMVTVAMRNISPVQAGAASGFINTVRQVGGTVGSAVVGAVLQNQLASNMHSQAVRYAAASHLPARFTSGFVQTLSNAGTQGFHLGRGQAGGTPQVPAGVPAQVAHQLTILGREVYQHAYLNAMKPSLALPIAVLALGALTTLFMTTSRRAEEAGVEAGHQRAVAVGE